MKFEAKIPAHRAFAPGGIIFENFVSIDRLLWQTGIHVLSIKLIPVQRPMQQICRNIIISRETRASNSKKRLYERQSGNKSAKFFRTRNI
jgi:hypothetical protein